MIDKVQKAEWRLQGLCTDCGGELYYRELYYHAKLIKEQKPSCSECFWTNQSIGRGLRGGLKNGEISVWIAGTGEKSTYAHR